MNIGVLFLFAILGGTIISRERKHYAERITFENMAKGDYLTGLYNHRTFQEHLRELLEKNAPLFLVMSDIDNFKSINDTYGHVTSDHVLKNIGNCLKELPDGEAYRCGGEEFAMIITTASGQLVQEGIKNISRIIEETNRELLPELRVTMSFGFSRYAGEKAESFISRTDKKLYEAKTGGKNQVVGSG
ncbi:GGDEF domain-containing protein [Alteribacter keqinensis]|uniref:GGDEF domain-containing protein n=1 Tax=Alteribacter keqinensis TaxID=2483800 RepID=UPI0016065755|nr:GGDEF domain-containing protein [Alteribacter keqinensis]